ARILTDRKMEKTELGAAALSCAAADDVTAWCLLALVIGVAQASVGGAVWVIGEAIAFIALMFIVAKPLLTGLVQRAERTTGTLSPLMISGTFLAVLLSSLTTEAIGIHAVFGAFVMGAIIPHDSRIAHEFTTKLK